MSDNDDLLSNDKIDKVAEYFKLKSTMKNLRNDLKDLKIQKDEYKELEELMKKVKPLREKLKEDETIKELTEKISLLKERGDLIKELIRIELLENALEEVKREGKKLKLVYILKELKDNEKEDDKKKPSRPVFR